MKTKEKLFLLVTAIGVMLLCTKSSPLYPFNDWGDANIYFTIGKGLFSGKVLYRDLFDHKGPLIYVAYGLAGLISQKTFFGVWLLEIAAAYLFLYASCKTVRLFCEEKVIVLAPFFAAIVYAANHMRHGGSAEELCLPLLAYGLYILVKYAVREELLTKELFLIGVTSAVVLWTKYTMLGFYIGWIVLPAWRMIRKKEWKRLGAVILWIGAGVLTVTIPVFLYFVWNGAVSELLTVYFYNNIFVYAGEKAALTEMAVRILKNTARVIVRNPYMSALTAAGLIWLFVKKHTQVLAAVLSCFLCLILTVLSAGYVHGYYSMCLSVFCCFGTGAVYELGKLLFLKYVKHPKVFESAGLFAAGTATVFMFVFSYAVGYNSDLLLCKKEELPQFQFAQIIVQSEDPSLLNYGFLDGGFYTAAGVDPEYQYFFQANIDLKEMKEQQDMVVEKGMVEFVVTQDEQYDWALYEEIASADFKMEGQPVTYYLYQLTSKAAEEREPGK